MPHILDERGNTNNGIVLFRKSCDLKESGGYSRAGVLTL